MREPLLDDSFSQASYSPDPEKPQQINRRRFLQTIGIVGIGLALSPQNIFADVPAMEGETEKWRERVVSFVHAVCQNNVKADLISAELSNSDLYYAPNSSDFHSSFRAPYIYGARISPEVVICRNGFEVNRFPFYDVECPCRNISDLNAFEIRRIINVKEVSFYKCVVVPVGRRTPLGDGDHADFRRTARAYDLDPKDFQPVYKRAFYSRNKDSASYGYLITHNTEVGENGKPLSDLLLSSVDI